ncbi:helix-turn-helix transcriptional regulator [Herbidospora galbida]|uniref:Helix-turn-helix transcriptional regulator n=1 Tax=Herbidospora galbida TaxID=2575442 RepID=A0A4U3MN41_9ACTN|nr:helix-turn-helix transcriptional regulator [Herbidospora galbida]TKK90112.1 helix-turn-helix transcriptional regulator [Herbidospora galbida]
MESFGEALRRLRGDLSIRGLARRANCSPSYISALEFGKNIPSSAVVSALDAALGAGGELIRLHDMEVGPTERREALGLIGVVLGGVSGALPATDGLERIRMLVERRLGGPDLGFWEEVAWEHAHGVGAHPATDGIGRLSADVLALETALTHVKGNPPAWARVRTRLLYLLAYALGSAGREHESRHWWAAARRAAVAAGDDMRAFVAAQEAIQALYEKRPLTLVLSRAGQALADDRPSVARARALGARAHAKVLLGDLAAAYADLDEQARVFDRLPSEVTGDAASAEGWPVTRLLHSRSLVYTLAGHPGAAAAQAEAVAAYPPGAVRPVAQIRMHEAMSAIRGGEVVAGLAHAERALTVAQSAGYSHYVGQLATMVADQAPAGHEALHSFRDRVAGLRGGMS